MRKRERPRELEKERERERELEIEKEREREREREREKDGGVCERERRGWVGWGGVVGIREEWQGGHFFASFL